MNGKVDKKVINELRFSGVSFTVVINWDVHFTPTLSLVVETLVSFRLVNN